ncbi:MAG: ABC transporter ATP-binding protein [Kurthia sp.]|nr:ABC transporter ATP-binding protein [Candidatus Kurthia equi]
MLHLQNVVKKYGEAVVLHNVDARFEAASFHFICGKSGSGKSTFLKLIDREIDADSGVILWQEKDIKQYKKYQLRRQMGIIFQSFELIPQMTVLENVLLAGRALGFSKKELLPRAEHLLQRVGLADKHHAYPHQLSGGQMQRVAIVRALLNKPSLLLADEPTGNLDEDTAQDVMQLLYELHQEEKMAMIIVTHSKQLLQQFDAKVWLVEEGQFHEQ